MKYNFINELTEIMPAIQEVLNAVTQTQIDRFASKLDAPGAQEKTLGTLHSELAIRLYCASNILGGKSKETGYRSQSADSDEQEKELVGEAKRLEALANITREMLWYEVRQSMAYWSGNIGIRRNWMIVAPIEGSGGEMPDILKKILGLGE